MRKFAVAFALLSSSALAADPATLIMPTPVVTSLAQYLAKQPYGDVAVLMKAIQECVAVQVPNSQGAIVSHGECPTVTAAMQAQHQAEHPPAEALPHADSHP